MIEALSRRGVDDRDLEVLCALAELRSLADRRIGDLVTILRGHPSACSWSEIGTALGISPQAAQQRYRKAGGVRRPGGQETRYR
jgi:hypothetical protein